MYLLSFEVFLVWERFDGSYVIAQYPGNLSTTRYDLTPTSRGGKLYEKFFFLHLVFTLYLNTGTSVVEFSLALYFNKNGDRPWGRCWPIYLELKPSLNCWIAVERAEITYISIHINANQNSYHDDESIL